MGKIVCLMGKSSTGKDTLFKELLSCRELGLKPVVPYTTRPIRDGETQGTEYLFTDEEGYRRLKASGKVAEERSYHTYHGLWRYFTVDDGAIDTDRHSYLMIGTLEAYLGMCRYFGGEKVLPLLIELDDGERLQRALDREKLQEVPRYEELCRRFLADAEDFSEDKVIKAGIERRFYNDELGRCMEEIREYLRNGL